MSGINLESLFGKGITVELEDVFSGEMMSRYEAVTESEREKRKESTDASTEFQKLLSKTEIKEVFIRLKDK